MAGKDHHSDGRPRSTRASNVIRLRPRQWLDTAEELVPIGGTATESAPTAPNESAPALDDASVPGHATAWLGAGEQAVPMAPEPAGESPSGAASWAASDFWGEDAALVQDAVSTPAPAVLATEGPAAAVPATEGDVPAVPAAEPHESSRARPRLPSLRWSPRASALGALVIAVAAVIFVAISGLGSEAAAPRSAPRLPSQDVSASSIANAAATLGAARLGTTRAHVRKQPRARSHITASRHTARGDHHRSIPATSGVAAHDTAPATPSTPAPTITRSVTPSERPTASPPARAGPTGTVSLIGAGTSSSG